MNQEQYEKESKPRIEKTNALFSMRVQAIQIQADAEMERINENY